MTAIAFGAVEDYANGTGQHDVDIERCGDDRICISFGGFVLAEHVIGALQGLPPGANFADAQTRWFCESDDCRGAEESLADHEHWYPVLTMTFDITPVTHVTVDGVDVQVTTLPADADVPPLGNWGQR